MKKLFVILIVVFLSSCVSWHTDWALNNGYIRAEDCPDVSEVPPRQALPTPNVPLIDISRIEDPVYLMKTIINLRATVEKFQYLVEIYEREYLNKDGKIMKDLTLEELKQLYESKLSDIEKASSDFQEFPSTEAFEREITISEFKELVEQLTPLMKEWNE